MAYLLIYLPVLISEKESKAEVTVQGERRRGEEWERERGEGREKRGEGRDTERGEVRERVGKGGTGRKGKSERGKERKGGTG